MKSIYFAIFGDGDFDFGVFLYAYQGFGGYLLGYFLDLGLQLLIHIDL